MQTTRLSPAKYIWGMVASLIILVAGGWLILAPFALGYQPYGASWDSQTTNDFVTGIPVAVVALVSFSFFFLSLLGALRAAGILAARQGPQVPVAAQAPAAVPLPQASQQSELDQTLATLAAALAADLTARRQAGSNQQTDQRVDQVDQVTNRRDV
jgi:hypothetical protein